MKPIDHARISVKKFGGKIEDYLPLHDFLDHTKAHFPDMRHRAILHNSWGIYMGEHIYGTSIQIINNGHAKIVSVRDILEQHVIDDLGRIPTLQDYLEGMPIYDWLGGPQRKKKKLSWNELQTATGVEIVD